VRQGSVEKGGGVRVGEEKGRGGRGERRRRGGEREQGNVRVRLTGGAKASASVVKAMRAWRAGLAAVLGYSASARWLARPRDAGQTGRSGKNGPGEERRTGWARPRGLGWNRPG